MLNRTMVATALMMGLAGVGSAPAMRSTPQITATAPRRAKERLFGGYSMPPPRYNYGGPGTTAAQIKRASKKAKNVKRHKRALRK